MKSSEIIRIIVLSLVGALLMFLVQPAIYQNRIIRINVPRIEAWVSNYYTIGALIVFGVSIFSVLIWCVMVLLSRAFRAEDLSNWSVIWWIIGLLPVLSIGVALGFFRGSDDALLSLTGFFVFDILWLYWLPTATSTPGLFKHIPPLAFKLRGLIGD
jgi:lipoprotein signal peptidase